MDASYNTHTPPATDSELQSQPITSLSTEANPNKRSSGARLFTPRKSSRAPQIATLNPGDYEKKYPEDESGHEIDPGARVWRVYLDEAERLDTEMVDRWRDGIDVLLVFAGLFSAVVTAFVVESANKFSLDNAEVNTSLLMELIALQRAAAKGLDLGTVPPSTLNSSSHPTYTQRDLWINGLWVASLVCSISTALMATVARQWMQYYITTVSGNPRDRVRIRQLRHEGFERWGVPTIVGLIPLLLHVAVFLFLWGLFLFYYSLNHPMAWSIASIGGAVCAFYITSALLPLFFPNCPYRTPVAGWVYRTRLFLRKKWNLLIRRMERRSSEEGLFGKGLSHIHTTNPYKKDFAWPQSREILLLKDRSHALDVKALMWMATSPNQSVQFIAAQALGGLERLHEKHTKPTKLSSSGLEDAAIRMYKPHTALSAETSDRMFRTYCCLSRWRVQWLSHPKSLRKLTSSEKEEADKHTIMMVKQATDLLQEEHEAILVVQKRYEVALNLQNKQENAADIKGYDTVADLRHEMQVRSKFFHDHVSAFGSPKSPDPELWLLPTLQGLKPFAFLRLFFSVFGPTSPEYQTFMSRLGSGVLGSETRRERIQAFIRELNETREGAKLARTLIQAEPSLGLASDLTEKTSIGEDSRLGLPSLSSSVVERSERNVMEHKRNQLSTSQRRDWEQGKESV